MATYNELLALSSNADLLARCKVAVVIAADVVRQEADTTTNHAARIKWAGKVLTQPDLEGQRALFCALAQNAGLTSGQISGATDAALQTAVNAAVDLLAIG